MQTCALFLTLYFQSTIISSYNFLPATVPFCMQTIELFWGFCSDIFARNNRNNEYASEEEKKGAPNTHLYLRKND
jgi:hypothetical protein